MQLEVSSGIDWFDLHGDVDFGDGRSAPFPQLLAAIARGEDVVVSTTGAWGCCRRSGCAVMPRSPDSARAEGDTIRFGRSQAALLDALLAAQPAIAYDETFARRPRPSCRVSAAIMPPSSAESFRGTLREYQREALGWFEFLRRFGFGGCLADDMGLGKTVMVLALLDALRARAGRERRPLARRRSRSLVFNWMRGGGAFRAEAEGRSTTRAGARSPRPSAAPTSC